MEMITGEHNPAVGVEIGIKLVHLISGEDIVGNVFTDDGGFRIERPIAVIIQQNGASLNIAPMPVRPYLKKDSPLFIRDGHVLYLGELDEKMVALYRQVHSNIVVAGPQDVPQGPSPIIR